MSGYHLAAKTAFINCFCNAAPGWYGRSCSSLVSGGTDYPWWGGGSPRRWDVIRFRRRTPPGRLHWAVVQQARPSWLVLRRRRASQKATVDDRSWCRVFVLNSDRAACTYNTGTISINQSINQSINIRLMRGMSKRRPTHVWHTIEWT